MKNNVDELTATWRNDKNETEPLEEGFLKDLEAEMGYVFLNKSLLKNALTQVSNKRTAFFGDAVLDFVVSEYLFTNFSELEQGDLTNLKARLVCDKKLEKVVLKKNWDSYLVIEKGIVEKTKKMNSTLLEAMVGAVYLDGGLPPAVLFVRKHIITKKDIKKQQKNLVSSKVRLYEFCQRRYGGYLPKPFLISEEGPPHDKRFTMGYLLPKKITNLNEDVKTQGSGKSKADAETKAAVKMNNKLIRLGLMEKI